MGQCYVAEDARRQVLIVGQRMHAIQHAIEECVGEPRSMSSLFESAGLKLRKGRTGNWRVHRVRVAELPVLVEELRPKFQRCVIASVSPDNWRLVAA